MKALMPDTAIKKARKTEKGSFFQSMQNAGLVGCSNGLKDAARNHSQYLKVWRAKKKAAA